MRVTPVLGRLLGFHEGGIPDNSFSLTPILELSEPGTIATVVGTGFTRGRGGAYSAFSEPELQHIGRFGRAKGGNRYAWNRQVVQ
jgi:hypothetical protein